VGTTRVVEAVAFPLEAEQAIGRATRDLVDGLCLWCGEVIAESRCPFCGMERPLVVESAAGEGR
jgi:hypothetical protein